MKQSVRPAEDEAEQAVIKIFEENHRVYGTRKIKAELKKLDMTVSRRRIGRLMKKNGLVSVYTIAQYKLHKSQCNESEINNVLKPGIQERNTFRSCCIRPDLRPGCR